MRKLVLFIHVSLDGFAADANGGLDWISYDSELQQYADGLVATVGSASVNQFFNSFHLFSLINFFTNSS